MMSALLPVPIRQKHCRRGWRSLRQKSAPRRQAFFICTKTDEFLRCEACIGPTDITGLEIPPRQGIVGAVTQSDEMRFVADTSKDSDFTGAVDAKTGFETKSMICVPVSGNGRRFGALQVINRRDGVFSDSMMRRLCRSMAKAPPWRWPIRK